MQSIKNYIILEGKYGPTDKEAEKKLNSPKCKKYQEILDRYFELGKKELKKFFSEYDEGWCLRLPQVWDGATRRLSRHMEYDDVFIKIPNTSIYYIINKDELFGFEVTYSGEGAGTYVSGEKIQKKVNIFSSKSAKFFYDVIKELNPETKITIEDLEAD